MTTSQCDLPADVTAGGDVERACGHILEGLAQGAPLEKSLAGVLDVLGMRMPACSGALMVARGDVLEPIVTMRNASRYLERMGRQVIAADGSVCGRAVWQRHPVMVQSLEYEETTPRHRKAARACGFKAGWFYPVIGRNRAVLGVLAIYSVAAEPPTQRQREWLRMASATAAIAMFQQSVAVGLSGPGQRDALTGLLNRDSFMEEAARILALAQRYAWRPGLVSLSLNAFSNINNALGHQAGDFVLRETASRLRMDLRDTDCLVRMGGDEFAVLLPEMDVACAEVLAGRITRSLRRPVDLCGDRTVRIDASIGMAIAPTGAETVDEMIALADAAMHRAKAAGGGWVLFDPDIH
ncbi:MAG: sensor domain-containing diguanylate cyclase [Aquisalimonadaceae bacterium]